MDDRNRTPGTPGGTSAAHALDGERVRLEPLAPGQAAGVAAQIAGDPEASVWWGTNATKIQGWLTEDGVFPFAVMVDGEIAGMVEFSEENDPDYRYASIDIALFSPFVGRGFGPDVIRTLLRFLFAERGHHRATIDPNVDNPRAIKAYEKVGFRPVGVMRRVERDPQGVWRDGLLMDILAEELE